MMRCVRTRPDGPATALFITAFFAFAIGSFAAEPSCDPQCHVLAYCELDGGGASFCACMPGTLDTSGGDGSDCTKNGYTVRYVVNSGNTDANPSATLTAAQGLAKCPAGAEGYYVRVIDTFEEVNCLYQVANKPEDTTAYGTVSPEGFDYEVMPAIYRWVLPTTESPLEIPPTGMTVDSVHFQPACAESGCWVIKGVATTGEAFNSYGAFNTFFLPQTNIKWGDVWDTEEQGCDVTFARANTSGICWKSYTDSVTYVEAKAICSAMGGRVVTVHNEEENDRLKTLQADNNLGDIWLGLVDGDVEGDFFWSDGSPGPSTCEFAAANDIYHNWGGRDTDSGFVCSEPNNWPSHPIERDGSDGEDCVHMYSSATMAGVWNDNSCKNTYRVVCEVQAPDAWPDPNAQLSYDFDYGHIDWTYAPAQHPCTSATYNADTDNTDKISTCCITDPQIGDKGGFVANYRPTESFVDWAGTLHCDVSFNRNGSTFCWKFYNDHVTYETAVDRCEVAGGYPAMILGADENQIMYENLCEPDYTMCDKDVWLGFTDAKTEGEYEWIRNNTLNSSFTNWAPGEPNNVGSGEDCTEFYATGGKYSTAALKGEWNDISCTQSRRYVCEFAKPVFPLECINHVVQRPDYTAPKRDVPCWYVKTDALPFEEAEAQCVLEGGHLASIRDAEENWFLRRLITFKGAGGNVWIGFSDNENITDGATEGTFGWIDGTPITFSNWNRNEPNDWTHADGNGEDCAHMFSTGLWNDNSCAQPFRYVCQKERADGEICHSDELENLDPDFDITFPSDRGMFNHVGKFKGMSASPGIVNYTNTDPFYGQYAFEIKLDEVELRSKAGKLRGTVGVEHTVDTFLGMANFRPTGLPVLDTFATQTAIHLEKTNFFSVSTHGTNELTFLEYVNMRLIQVLAEDADFSSDAEADDRTVQTSTAGNIAYIQVTFTMGAQYQPNLESGGLVPQDSVRAGFGTFFDDVNAAGHLEHVCDIYLDDTETDVGLTTPTDNSGAKTTFDNLIAQSCGPQSSMCLSPTTVPDAFVSYNIPLGFETFDGRASADLSSNIFVEFVVNAVDTSGAGTSGMGDAPDQVKTTLTASIPIVEGGINIFCDGFTAKTDLKDVANVDIVVGTANSTAELSRLRIIEDIASTDLAEVDSAQIDTASIESALMTLVIKGNHSYFRDVNTNTMSYTMELDDVITIHLMEDGEATDTNSLDTAVQGLLATAGDDNSDTNGLDTDGYALNGAFKFTIDRDSNQAHLQPTDALLQSCPFNPPRPTSGASMQLESCIVRRDVRERGYPARTGSVATAMEIMASTTAGVAAESSEQSVVAGIVLGEASGESDFMASILGDSDYTRQLAVSFAGVIRSTYELNGRYRRAYWINPGYEWTPTQTAGKSIFTVSQKIYLFALISLDENWARRRMLLQTTTSNDALQEAAAGPGGASMTFSVSPKSLMASVHDVPTERVALFTVNLQLTNAEACMSPVDRQSALRSTLEAMLEKSASAFWTVQVTSMEVDLGDEVCPAGGRRGLRKLLRTLSSASATVEMLVVFKEGTVSQFNVAMFQAMEGVNSLQADANNSPRLDTSDNTYVPPEGTHDDDDKDSGSSTMLIAGIAGGIGGALVLALGVVLYMRSKTQNNVPIASAIQSVDVSQLKAQLANEAGPDGV